MNAIEKFHALLVTDEVNIWHFQHKKESPRFYFWLTSEPANTEGHAFDSLEEMIDAAYEHIDPLKKSLPQCVPPPSGSDPLATH